MGKVYFCSNQDVDSLQQAQKENILPMVFHLHSMIAPHQCQNGSGNHEDKINRSDNHSKDCVVSTYIDDKVEVHFQRLEDGMNHNVVVDSLAEDLLEDVRKGFRQNRYFQK